MTSGYDASIIHESDNVNITKFDRTEISGEVVIRENKQVTKQFIKKHFRVLTFPSTTEAQSGYSFIDKKNDQNYIIVQLDDINIHTEIAYKEGIGYRCNFSGEIQRNNESHSEFGPNDSWDVIERNVNGVIVQNWEDIKETPAGEVEVGDWNFYIPSYISGEVGDRIIFNSGEVDRFKVYKMKAVDKGNNFEGVKFIKLEEDKR